ncbi:hypothetical protein [Streptomyces chrestomyceticus]|nr:hypothetical protein [Streptomyces chrestomyceticus]
MSDLYAMGLFQPEAVERAVATVPRHLFAADESLESGYAANKA